MELKVLGQVSILLILLWAIMFVRVWKTKIKKGFIYATLATLFFATQNLLVNESDMNYASWVLYGISAMLIIYSLIQNTNKIANTKKKITYFLVAILTVLPITIFTMPNEVQGAKIVSLSGIALLAISILGIIFVVSSKMLTVLKPTLIFIIVNITTIFQDFISARFYVNHKSNYELSFQRFFDLRKSNGTFSIYFLVLVFVVYYVNHFMAKAKLSAALRVLTTFTILVVFSTFEFWLSGEYKLVWN